MYKPKIFMINQIKNVSQNEFSQFTRNGAYVLYYESTYIIKLTPTFFPQNTYHRTSTSFTSKIFAAVRVEQKMQDFQLKPTLKT